MFETETLIEYVDFELLPCRRLNCFGRKNAISQNLTWPLSVTTKSGFWQKSKPSHVQWSHASPNLEVARAKLPVNCPKRLHSKYSNEPRTLHYSRNVAFLYTRFTIGKGLAEQISARNANKLSVDESHGDSTRDGYVIIEEENLR